MKPPLNEQYYSAVESKKIQEHLTTEKNKTSWTVLRRLRTGDRLSEIKRAAEEQCVEPSLACAQRWRRDDTLDVLCVLLRHRLFNRRRRVHYVFVLCVRLCVRECSVGQVCRRLVVLMWFIYAQ